MWSELMPLLPTSPRPHRYALLQQRIPHDRVRATKVPPNRGQRPSVGVERDCLGYLLGREALPTELYAMVPQQPQHGAFAQSIGLHQLSARHASFVVVNQLQDYVRLKPPLGLVYPPGRQPLRQLILLTVSSGLSILGASG